MFSSWPPASNIPTRKLRQDTELIFEVANVYRAFEKLHRFALASRIKLKRNERGTMLSSKIFLVLANALLKCSF